MIKIEHTLFALPFAFLGAVLAARGVPTAREIHLDHRGDGWRAFDGDGFQSNCRSRIRCAQSADAACGQFRPACFQSDLFGSLLLYRAALFFVAAAMLNRLTLLLAPVALASVVLYSFTKRWTCFRTWCWAGVFRSRPPGAWIAVRGAIDSPVPLLLSLVVLLWTAGFDVLYACQDYEFDRRESLRSIPARFGIARSLWIARALHAGAFAALVALYWFAHLGRLALIGVVITAALLIYQHTLVRADDLSRLNAAFFTTNAFVSVILFVTFGAQFFSAIEIGWTAKLVIPINYELFTRLATLMTSATRVEAGERLEL